MKRQIRFAFLVLAGLGLSGCLAGHMSYPLYEPQSPPYGSVLPLRVAIPYPEEGLQAPNRDQDLEPLINSQCAEIPTYISQRLEAGRGLLAELRATGAFAALHWTPPTLDDYDLVVKMKILSAGERFESPTCPGVLGPFRWELRLLDQRGAELFRREYELAKVRIYSSSPVANFRRDQAAFFGAMTADILRVAAETARRSPGIADERAVAYAEKKSPGLRALADRAAADKRLGRDYLARVVILEAGRQAEERSAEALQPLYDKAWLDLQLALRADLKQLGEKVKADLLESVSSLVSVGRAAGIKPPKVLAVLTETRAETARRAAQPDAAGKLVAGLSKKLLPHDLRRIAAEAGVNEELAAKLRAAVGMEEPGTPGGCGKDTDCKGDRICVKGACVNP